MSHLGLYDTARAQYDTKLSALQGEILTIQGLLQGLHDDIERLRQDGGGSLLITHEATLWGHWRAITKLIAHLQFLQAHYSLVSLTGAPSFGRRLGARLRLGASRRCFAARSSSARASSCHVLIRLHPPCCPPRRGSQTRTP